MRMGPTDCSPAGRGRLLLEGRQDYVNYCLVAQAACVQDHVVVAGEVAVVAVDLLDVGGPVFVGPVHELARLLLGSDLESLHDRLHPHRLRGAEENMERSWEIVQEISAAAADDHHVPRPGRLLDDVVRDLQDRFAGVERGVGVGRAPGRHLGWDQRLRARGAQRDQEPGEQGAGGLVLGLDLLLGKLEPVRDLIDDPRFEQVDMKPLGKHLAHRRAPRPKLAANRDDRHLGANLLHQAGLRSPGNMAGLDPSPSMIRRVAGALLSASAPANARAAGCTANALIGEVRFPRHIKRPACKSTTSSMAGAPAINGAVLTSSDELSPLKARIPTVGSSVVMTDRSDARRMTVWVAAFADWPEDSAEFSAMRFASRLAVTFATWPAA